MSSIEDVGAVIHVLRVIRRLSQGDLAGASGVRNSSISNYERGKSMPKLETLQKLADGLDLPLSVVEETQHFINHIRSNRAGEVAEGGLPQSFFWTQRAGGPAGRRREGSDHEAEIEQLAGEAGRLAANFTRLVLEILTAGRSAVVADPAEPTGL